MKKTLSLMIGLCLLSSFAFANSMSPEEARKAHREQMKAVKAEMREKEKVKTEPSKWSQFWKNEGERSGMNRWKAGDVGKNLNPVPFFKDQSKRYEDRKTTQGK